MFKRIEPTDIPNSELGKCIDLASAALNSSIVEVSDEFFGKAKNLLNPEKPVHKPDYFVDTGYWMDGWESRRHCRTQDWVVIKLGFPGSLSGFDIDTSYFTGNQAPAASVEITSVPDDNITNAKWTTALPKVDLPPNSHNVFVLSKQTPVCTHIRLNNIPDGGIARFRAYGTIKPTLPKDPSAVLDLAFVGNGAKITKVSNQFYTPASNLLLPGRGVHMGDGWQTNRSRQPGNSDYVIIRLATKGHILKIELDTSHFKGNFPDRVTLQATDSAQDVPPPTAKWTVIADRVETGPHGLFYFDSLVPKTPFTHVKLIIIPDGGLKRVRLWGVPEGAKIPALPIKTPLDKPMLVAQPLTREDFAPFGDVIQASSGIAVTSANQGTAEKYHQVGQVINDFAKGRGRSHLSVFHCRPATEVPFTVKLLERHPFSSQAFIPMTDGRVRGYLVIVALNGADDKPDMKTLKAFIASSTQGINYREGIWHHPMVALEHETDFACLVHESGIPKDDCNEVDVKEVVVDVPGFHT
ncbi:ureidoglycolate hydrolase-domain-containing protein [Phycomyces nitens]|nr:ureidoglycolate hydrolase-domain-containing protein [Phycomyces nitens]